MVPQVDLICFGHSSGFYIITRYLESTLNSLYKRIPGSLECDYNRVSNSKWPTSTQGPPMRAGKTKLPRHLLRAYVDDVRCWGWGVGKVCTDILSPALSNQDKIPKYSVQNNQFSILIHRLLGVSILFHLGSYDGQEKKTACVLWAGSRLWSGVLVYRTDSFVGSYGVCNR